MTTSQRPSPISSTSANYVGMRSFSTAALLSFFLGYLGADRFYMGYMGLGILKFLTLGGFGIWALVDLILILNNKLRDADGYQLHGYEQDKKPISIFVVLGLIYEMASSLIIITMLITNLHTSNSITPVFDKMLNEVKKGLDRPDITQAYNEIHVTMQKAEVESILGRTATQCDETLEQDVVTEHCVYYDELSPTTIEVDYRDGIVIRKSKLINQTAAMPGQI